jgi:hypothetical protein
VEGRVRLVTFSESDQKPRPGALDGDRVVDLSDQIGSIQEVIDGGPELLLSVHYGLDEAHSQVSLTQVTLLAPILNLPRIFAVAGLSRSRVETHQAIPKAPTILLKLTSASNGPHSTIVLPKLMQQPDYEAEFAFVIVKGGKDISADRWQEHVFGYTIMNGCEQEDLVFRRLPCVEMSEVVAESCPAVYLQGQIGDLDVRIRGAYGARRGTRCPLPGARDREQVQAVKRRWCGRADRRAAACSGG